MEREGEKKIKTGEAGKKERKYVKERKEEMKNGERRGEGRKHVDGKK